MEQQLSPVADRATWLKQRRTGVGGSDSATLFGANPYSSLLALYLDKVQGLEDEDTEPAYWGRILEPAVRQAYEEKTGRRVRPGVVMARHAELDCMIVNTDGTIDPVPEFDGCGVYEGKVTSVLTKGGKQHGDLKLLSWAEGVPLAHEIQLQHGMAVTGLSWGGFACLKMGARKDMLERVDRERNERFIVKLMERIDWFWRKHVLPRIPPKADDSEASRKALLQMHPTDNGRVYVLPSTTVQLLADYREAKADEAAAKKRAEGLGNQLRQVLGDHSFGYSDDADTAVSYREERARLSAKDVLEVVEGMMGEAFRDQVEVALEQGRGTQRVLRQVKPARVREILEVQQEQALQKRALGLTE